MCACICICIYIQVYKYIYICICVVVFYLCHPLTLIHPSICSDTDDREALVKELTEYTSADISDFSTLVKASDKKQNQDPADIISQHLAAAQDVGDRITSSVISQDDLLKEILVGNENFVRARKSDPVTVQRDAMVRYAMCHTDALAVPPLHDLHCKPVSYDSEFLLFTACMFLILHCVLIVLTAPALTYSMHVWRSLKCRIINCVIIVISTFSSDLNNSLIDYWINLTIYLWPRFKY